MKNTTKLILPAALLFFVLAVTGCPQQGKPSGTENSGTNPHMPQSPIELTEAELLSAFSLEKGSITASAAAKKIATGTPAGGITFTQKTAVSYDDQAGTFTVKVKGTKNGKNFKKTFNLTGFTHPLAEKTIQSLGDCELNLDDAIEHNYSLAKYITEVNKDPSGKKLVKKLSFLLSGGTTTIELGEHDSYTLTANAKKSDTKILVQPSVKIVFRKLTEDGTEELTDNTDFEFTHLKDQLTKDYFKAKDVFQYILDKTADIAIKADSKEFASSFYAFAKKSEQVPADLFTDAFKMKIQEYHGRYHNNPEGHLALDISYGAFQPKTGGIDADDYTGTVKINLCIATAQQIADQSGIEVSKPVEKSGFASIPDDAALAKKNHLFFNLIPKASLSSDDKTSWKNKAFSRALLRINESNGNAIIDNPFGGSDSLFHLCVNSENTNPTAYLGSAGGSYGGASKTKNNKVIFIENIQLEKKAGSTSMEVQVKLKGSGPILKVITKP